MDWLVSEGVRIVNHSVGNFTAPQDGSALEDRIVDEAASKGVVWVNAVGNSGAGHYSGVFKDYGSGWHEWRPGGRLFPIVAPFGEVTVILSWDDWPASSIDYDLFLLDSTGITLDWSSTLQSGSQPPVEGLSGYCLHEDGCLLYAAVRKYSPGHDARLTLWSETNGDNFPYFNVSEGSILCPATARGAWAVGAVSNDTLFSEDLEPFSSRGPTADGRIKPDFVAPDGVATVTSLSANPPNLFFGTSAAAPHVAGIAALVLSTNPSLTVDEMRRFLEKRARHLGSPGKNNQYGVGIVDIGPLPQLVAGIEGNGAIALGEANASFAFGVGKTELHTGQGWATYQAPGLGKFQSSSVGRWSYMATMQASGASGDFLAMAGFIRLT